MNEPKWAPAALPVIPFFKGNFSKKLVASLIKEEVSADADGGFIYSHKLRL